MSPMYKILNPTIIYIVRVLFLLAGHEKSDKKKPCGLGLNLQVSDCLRSLLKKIGFIFPGKQ